MLKQRVITAVLMLLVLLPAMFYPSPDPFCAIALVLISAGAWEWARLNHYSGREAILTGVTCFTFGALSWWFGLLREPFEYTGIWVVAGVLWVLGGAWLLQGGVARWSGLPISLRLALGLVALWMAWLAVAQARVIGINFLMSALVLVWVADIFAYFSGRALGGRFARGKLAPSISPGKSWEGVWGGMLGVIALAFSWVWLDTLAEAQVASVYTRLQAQGWFVLFLGVLLLAAMSVVGDLIESLIKRSAGVKDSSNLLPGHGGVLDRVDALLPTLPLVMLAYSLFSRHAA